MSLTPLNACSPVMRGWGSVRALYLEIRVRGRSVALSVSMRACLCFDCTYLHVRAPYTSDGATHLLYHARALSLPPSLRVPCLLLSPPLLFSLFRAYRLRPEGGCGHRDASTGMASATGAGREGAEDEATVPDRRWVPLCFWLWRQVGMLAAHLTRGVV